jgi:hypothetical protein
MTDIDPGPQPTGGPHPSTSADQIAGAVRDAGEASKSAMSDAKEKLVSQGSDKIDAASTTAGDSLRQVADQLRTAGDNLGEDQGWAKQAFSQGAQGLERVSGYLRDGRLDDFTRDLQSFARSNPAAFLAGSVAVGFIAARVAKTAAEHATTRTSPAVTEPQASYGIDVDGPRAPTPSQPVVGGASFGGDL